MSTEKNKQLVTDYLENVWNQGKVDEAGRYLATGLVQHNPALPDGIAPLADFVSGLRTAVPGGRFAVRRIAADGDLVFAHSHFTAGEGDPGTAVVDVFRIEDDLIAEHWDVSAGVPETTVSGHPVV
ncbi:nuclear transport factor 2 family protein [Kitasatospora phosalacinea]|uniref:nuclear transport factor 2 family protein n=1 Tax=Kitasatospora phosalacinea TaxID=2065 RepID=UPI0036525F42